MLSLAPRRGAATLRKAGKLPSLVREPQGTNRTAGKRFKALTGQPTSLPPHGERVETPSPLRGVWQRGPVNGPWTVYAVLDAGQTPHPAADETSNRGRTGRVNKLGLFRAEKLTVGV
jgi:hypothetical protein